MERISNTSPRLGARQDGLGTWGTMLLVVMLIFAALIGMKVVPMFIDSYSIKDSLESLGAQNLAEHNKKQIREALLKRFDISSVKAVSGHNISDVVTITKQGKRTHIVIAYRDEASLFGNISVVGDFKYELQQ